MTDDRKPDEHERHRNKMANRKAAQDAMNDALCANVDVRTLHANVATGDHG